MELRLIVHARNYKSRKILLRIKPWDILRAKELTDMRVSDMTTEEANVNRVKLKKTKTPKTPTEDTTSYKQTSGRGKKLRKGTFF